MKAHGFGFLAASLVLAACSGTGGQPAERPATPPGSTAAAPAVPASPAATGSADDTGSPGAALLLRPKVTDEEFQAAITALESANPEADAAAAMASGDHRLFAVQGAVLEAPGVHGDWRALPRGAYVVAVAGTSATAGSKYQQRFQMLVRNYVAKYNPALLAKLK
jgi:hypothetical protein